MGRPGVPAMLITTLREQRQEGEEGEGQRKPSRSMPGIVWSCEPSSGIAVCRGIPGNSLTMQGLDLFPSWGWMPNVKLRIGFPWCFR